MKSTSERWWDWLSVLCMAAALSVMARRLEVTHWVNQLDRSVSIVLFALVIGLMLGVSIWKPMWVKISALILSPFFIFSFLGAEYDIDVDWANRINDLLARLGVSLKEFLFGETVSDTLLFLTTMYVLLWTIGLVGGYLLARYRQPWIPLAIGGIALAAFDTFQPYTSYPFYSGVFVFAVIVLVARLHYLQNFQRYEESGIGLDDDTGNRLARISIIVALVLVWLSWNIPVVVRAIRGESPERRELIKTAQKWDETFNRLLAPLQNPALSTSEIFGSELGLGTSLPLSDDIVFTVQVDNKPKYLPRFYWRARAYEYYEGSEWQTGAVVAQNRQPGLDIIPTPLDEGRELVTLTVTNQVPISSQLFAPPTVLRADRSTNLLGVRTGSALYDSVGISMSPPVREGSSYTVESYVASPTREQLLAAENAYPDWVINRYLRVPDGLPKRISKLAQDITQLQLTQYDKVQAITNYLRTNIKYAESVQQPPDGWDPIDWFLFESKTGFCYYYASAETLMLRSIGIPARLAVGYAQGEYDETSKSYVVRRKHAHAWTEVYFAGLGWVEFEPTVSQPVVIRPSEFAQPDDLPATNGESTQSGANPDGIDQEERAEREFEIANSSPFMFFVYTLQRNLGWFIVLLVLVSIGLTSAVLKRKGIPIQPAHWLARALRKSSRVPDWLKNFEHFEGLSSIERAFMWVSIILSRFLKVDPTGLTPKEQIALLSRRVPECGEDAQYLLNEYQKTIYSPQPGNLSTARKASSRLVRRFMAIWFDLLLSGSLSQITESEEDYASN